MQQTSYQLIIDKLDAFIRKYYKNQILKGAIYTGAIIAAFYLIVTVLEYFSRFSPAVKIILLTIFCFTTIFILLVFIILPIIKLLKLGNTLSYEAAATIVGNHFVNIQDKLLNILQLNQLANTPSNENLSLIQASIDQKTQELKPVPFTNAIDLSENKKYLKYLLIPLGILVMLFIFSRNILTEGTKRLLAYDEAFLPPMPFNLDIENKNLTTASNQDFELKVVVSGKEIPQEIYILIDEAKVRLAKIDVTHFSYVFNNPTKSVKFQLWADGWSTPFKELKVLPNPSLTDFEVFLNYPDYTGKKDEVLKNSGDLIVPIGTIANWKFKTNNTNNLKIVFGDSNVIDIPKGTENNYQYNEKIMKNKSYLIAIANEYFKSKDSTRYNVNVITDAYPSININEERDSLNDKKIYFSGDIGDDYGFSSLFFHYSIINSTKPSRKINKAIALNIDKNIIEANFTYAIDVNTLPIEPGDEIDYFFEVADNDGILGIKKTKSQSGTYYLKTIEEMGDELENEKENLKEDISATIKELKKVNKTIEDLQRKMMDKKSLDYDDKKKLENLMQQQKDLQSQIQEIQKNKEKQQNKENQLDKKENIKRNEQILEKKKELDQLFDKVMDEDMKKKMEELEKLMEKLDKDKIQEQLKEMQLDNKELEKELDRNLELFKKLEVEQKLDEAMQELEKLQDEQKELNKKTEDAKTNNEELKKEQEQLNEDFKKLEEKLEDLKEKNEALEEPAEMEKIDEDQKDIEESMQESSEELNKKDKKEASKKQKNSDKKMQKLKQKLMKMKEQMVEEEGEDLEKLRDLLENIVQLSFDQERIMNQYHKINSNDPQYRALARQQNELKDNAKAVKDSLYEMSKRVVKIKSFVNKELEEITRNIDGSIQMLENRNTPAAVAKQQYTMTHFNNLALILSEAVSDMQQQQAENEEQQQQMKSSGSCKKPKSGSGGKKPKKGKPSQSLQSMKKLQDQINKQLEDMKKEGKPENQKGEGKPGQKGEGNSEQMAKMAVEQEKLRQGIQKLINDLEKEGDKAGAGQLKKIADDMEESATDIYNKKLTNEMMKRQKDITTRLLEAENAQREREQDNERKANESNLENSKSPNNIVEYDKLIQKQKELLRTTPATMTPYYKRKVNQYFQNIKKE